MAHTITIDVSFGPAVAGGSFSYTTDDVPKAQDDLFGIFHMLRKENKKLKKKGGEITDWTDFTIVQKVDGGAIRNGGRHSDATFNSSISSAWAPNVLEFFKKVKVS